MPSTFVRPTSRRGWLLLIAFILIIAAGCWPIIALVNHPMRVLGLPLIALWAYVIVLASVAVMALGNRWLARRERDASSDAPRDRSS
ncbi:hypothetical protein [Kushneria phosphatilytica]|uniref:Uncharacterized protein n=1 Tax=Kushneria phosphatilytica TaxID=657387 RepID=A0A1S1NQY2_9GAMM|nr:hypothetical protein [Kushneria phosphatilytica]OHV08179.1 hypothetical protein BH688_14455 [Kushneria phosphatilytica]QEL09922.1 hypothetical protein FY550_01425 [Kushneria phosphatilytica]